MNNYTTVVGLDVHKESVVAAVLPYGHKDVVEQGGIGGVESRDGIPYIAGGSNIGAFTVPAMGYHNPSD